jgi:hypothetical protein
MSRLIVIEPNVMLRYALAVALTPDHLVQFSAALPEAAALKNADAVVLDVATLRQSDKPVELDMVASWKLPTIWIDDREPASPPDRADWASLKVPLRREQLLKAVFDCLNPAVGSAVSAQKTATNTVVAPKTRAKKTKGGDTPASTSAANVIELVEVVDDGSENG